MGKKQGELSIEGEGVVAIHIDEIEHAADDYIKVRDAFVITSRKLQESIDALRTAMHNHEPKLGKDAKGGLLYRYDDQIIMISKGKETVKVRSIDAPAE
jgi:hypothetical protein